jgi:hypothetical protein
MSIFDQQNDLARVQRCYECAEPISRRKSHEDKRCLACQRRDIRNCSVCRSEHGANVVHPCE